MKKKDSNTPVSFKGTILESSYLPTFIPLDDQIIEEQIVTATGTIIEPNWYMTDPIGIGMHFVCTSQSLFATLWEWLTKSNKIKELRAQLKSAYDQAVQEYNYYKSTHENLLHEAENCVDVINRKKILMKDYLLNELHTRLLRMGIQSTWKDAYIEHIDLRKFPINEQYDVNKLEELKFMKNFELSMGYYDRLLCMVNSPLFLLPRAYLSSIHAKQLQESLNKLTTVHEDNTSRMDSDLRKLDKFKKALENVALIFTDILDCLMPIMKNLLTMLSNQYGNNLNRMPQEKMMALHRIKDILKAMSESVIIPKKDQTATIDSVIHYSNDLSKKQYDLKADLLKMVI